MNKLFHSLIARTGSLALALAAILLAQSQVQSTLAKPAATFTVFLLTDSGGGSLRWAINSSNATLGPNTITIVPTGIIQLLSDLPPISTDVTINGPAGGITIDGGGPHQVFVVSPNKSLTLNGIDITNGWALGNMGGGAIYLNHGTLNLNNSTLYSNGAYSNGGALFNESGAMNISNSTIRNNWAVYSASTVLTAGAGLYNLNGVTTIQNSTFSNNNCQGVAGGIFVDGGTVSASNSTFTGNSAVVSVGGTGGAFYVKTGGLDLTNSTVAANSATLTGGIFNSSGTVTLKNTIVANNVVAGNCSGGIINGGNNIDDGATCGWGTTNGSMSNANPLLGPLANNGGATKTMALLPGSPAIDGVTFNAPNGCPSTDQRGIARPIGARCDIGAYEAPVYPRLLLPLILR